jgi:arylsulfatase A-like enzyme
MKRAVLFILSLGSAFSDERPNVLWLTLEDTSPHFIGCYGNEAAKTPHIDSLAENGIRFEAAFANSPVCSAARATLITGTLNQTLGTGNHRSHFPLPREITGFPTFLKRAGYYTSNHHKTDYSTSDSPRIIAESWHESSGQAGWWKREEGQPFFSVFNIEDCHQSRTMTWSYDWYRSNLLQKLPLAARVRDDAFEMPPFLPDHPAARQHFARVYNSISMADLQVGEILQRLEGDGLRDETIIFCYADHGEAMPRGKANPIALGYRVPFIISFPEKWQHLNPWGPSGSVTHELVNFDDLGPTMLSLIGEKPAPWMSGRPLLGTYRADPPPFILCSRNRIDETEGCSRSLTDGRFLYTRHFLPRSEFPLQKYFDVSDIARLMRRENEEKKLSSLAAALFEPQPHEVLYDLSEDPWEIKNLSHHPQHEERLQQYREILFKKIIASRDVLFFPEYELEKISIESTPYEFGQQLELARLKAIVETAELASSPAYEPALRELVTGPDDILSYWAATAFRHHADYPRDEISLDEVSYPPARIEYAAALYRHDQSDQGKDALASYAASQNIHLRQQALQRIQELGPRTSHFRKSLQAALTGGSYETRCSAEMTLYQIGGPNISYPDPKPRKQ